MFGGCFVIYSRWGFLDCWKKNQKMIFFCFFYWAGKSAHLVSVFFLGCHTCIAIGGCNLRVQTKHSGSGITDTCMMGAFRTCEETCFTLVAFFFFPFCVEEGNMTQYGVRSSASCFLMPLFVWKGSSQTRTDFLLAPSVMWTSWRQCDMEWKVTSVGGSIRFRLLISPCRFNAWWLCVEYWPAGINHQSPFFFSLFAIFLIFQNWIYHGNSCLVSQVRFI